jgi:isoleucyl-tRNA synthetase
VEIDRYALALAREMATGCAEDYRKFEFHLVAQRLQTFCSEDLGGFWLDILKDRLYTAPAASAARRSAQSALHHVTQVLLRLMAPILSFTAEEAWTVLHPATDESVFFHTWKEVLPKQDGEPELLAKWKRLREIRAAVAKRLEESRAAGAIGSSLQAEVVLEAGGPDLELLRALGDDLKFVLITSRADLRASSGDGIVNIVVAPSAHPKCERCWHYRPDVGSDAGHPTICGRCVSNLRGPGEARSHA